MTKDGLIPERAALSLVLAVIASSSEPLVLLDGGLVVIAASTSFCRAFEIDPAKAVGGQVFDVGHGEWNVPQLRALLEATASGAAEVHAYEFTLSRAGQPPRPDAGASGGGGRHRRAGQHEAQG